MNKYFTWSARALVAFWAVFSVLASNSPDDVSSRLSGWLSLSMFSGVPELLVAFASNPIVLATSFLMLGAFIGWKIHDWRAEQYWYSSLGGAMSDLEHQIIQYMDFGGLVADINVVAVKANKHKFSFPSDPTNPQNKAALQRYLNQVSAHLIEGQVREAREKAKELS